MIPLFLLVILVTNSWSVIFTGSTTLNVFRGEQIKISCNHSSNSNFSEPVELWKDEVKIFDGKISLDYWMNPILSTDAGIYLCKYPSSHNYLTETIIVQVIDLNNIANVQIPRMVYSSHKSYFKCMINYNGSFTSKMISPAYYSKTSLRSEACVISHNGVVVVDKIVNFMPSKRDKTVFLEEFIPLKGSPIVKIVPPASMSKRDFLIRIKCDGSADGSKEMPPSNLIDAINYDFEYGTHYCRFVLSDNVTVNDHLQIAFKIYNYSINIQRIKRMMNDEFILEWVENVNRDKNLACYFHIKKNLQIIQRIPINLNQKSLIFNVSSNNLLNGEIICKSSTESISSNIAYFSLIPKVKRVPVKFHIQKVTYNSATLTWYDSHQDDGNMVTVRVYLCLIAENKTHDDSCSERLIDIDKSDYFSKTFSLKYLLQERIYKVNIMYKQNFGDYSEVSDDIIFKTKSSPYPIPGDIVVREGHNFIRISWTNLLKIDSSHPYMIFYITFDSRTINIHVMSNTTSFEINKDNFNQIELIAIRTSRFYDSNFILSNKHIVYRKRANKMLTYDLIFPFTFVMLFVTFFLGQLIYSCVRLFQESYKN